MCQFLSCFEIFPFHCPTLYKLWERTTHQTLNPLYIPQKGPHTKHSTPLHSTQRLAKLSLHNSWQTTAVSAPTSIKAKRCLHHYVAAPKMKNKQLYTSWKKAAYSPKSDLHRSKPSHSPQIMQHHINTTDVSSQINIFRMLQEQSISDRL
jgi:hypothetical protein